MSNAPVLLSKCLPLEVHRTFSTEQALVGLPDSVSGSGIVENFRNVEVGHKVEHSLQIIARTLYDLGAKVGVLGKTGHVIWREPLSILRGGMFPSLVAIWGFEEGWRRHVSNSGREGSALVLLPKIGDALMQKLTLSLSAQLQKASGEGRITIERIVYVPFPAEADTADSSSETSKAGRPSRQKEVLETYEKHFPHSHGNLPWKVVHSSLQIDVSLDTLKRASGRR